MGFIIHFYIIFGTNLLTQRPSPDCCFFAYFRVLQKRNIKRSPNGMKPSREIFLEKITHGRLENHIVGHTWCPRGWGAPPLLGAPPALWAPCLAPGSLLRPIYAYVPRNHQTNRENPSSTAVTFCSREIPSWGLFRSSAGGGIDHGGLLHQHNSLTNEL